MRVKLKDIFDLQMGKTPSRNNASYWGGKNKWISIADIGKVSKYITETKENITDDGVLESGIKKVPQNTVVMSFKLSIGKTAITTENMYTNEAIMAFIDKKLYPLDTNYFYHLCSGRDWSAGTNKAVMGLTLNKATLSEIEIELPPIDEQKAVATELDFIDSLIAARREQLAKLDELVKSRFIEMFGDPVSNPFRWSTLTMKQASIRLSDGPFGSNLKSEHYTDEGVRVIRLGNIGCGYFNDEDQSYISPEHYATIKKYTCRAGEIVIATLGDPNLRACIVPDHVEYGVNKSDCVHYIPKAEILNNQFVCQYINCPETLLLASGMVHGQTRSRISSGQLADLPIYLPPMDLQQQFTAFVEQIDKSKFEIQKSLEKLETLKKALMQKYFG